MFNFSLKQFVWRVLPIELRFQENIDWILVLLHPLELIYGIFKQKILEIDFLKQNSSQAIVLEALLNEVFVTTGIRIIDERSGVDQEYIYYLTENERQLYVYELSENHAPFYINYLDEQLSAFDFIVEVPLLASITENQIREWVDKYCLVDKRYSVVFV